MHIDVQGSVYCKMALPTLHTCQLLAQLGENRFLQLSNLDMIVGMVPCGRPSVVHVEGDRIMRGLELAFPCLFALGKNLGSSKARGLIAHVWRSV